MFIIKYANKNNTKFITKWSFQAIFVRTYIKFYNEIKYAMPG